MATTGWIRLRFPAISPCAGGSSIFICPEIFEQCRRATRASPSASISSTIRSNPSGGSIWTRWARAKAGVGFGHRHQGPIARDGRIDQPVQLSAGRWNRRALGAAGDRRAVQKLSRSASGCEGNLSAGGVVAARGAIYADGAEPVRSAGDDASESDARARLRLPVGSLQRFETEAKKAVKELAELAGTHDVTVFCENAGREAAVHRTGRRGNPRPERRRSTSRLGICIADSSGISGMEASRWRCSGITNCSTATSSGGA